LADGPRSPQGESEQDKDERLRHEAYALFEKHPELPDVLVEIHDGYRELEQNISAEAQKRLSEQRLEYSLQQLDIVGKAYLRLVTDFESARAYGAILNECLQGVWQFFAGFPLQSLFPTPLFSTSPPPPECLQRDRMVKRTTFWEAEGYRRVASLHGQQSGEISKDPSKAKTQRTIGEPRPDLLANLDVTLSRMKAAEALGISPRTLDRWVTDNKLTATGLGHRKRFKAKDLKRLLDQRMLDNRDKK